MQSDTETIDPITGEATGKTGTESTGQGDVAPQASQGEQDNAGQPQGESEDGKEQGTETRRPFRSKNQTIYELRQRIREQEGTFTQELTQLKQRLEEMARATTRGQNQKPSRTFWEAPEEVLDERITGHLSEMEKRILDRMEQRDTQSQQTAQWKQETSEAVKFITSQKELIEDDHKDIEEIIRSTPEMQQMSPMQRAKYALFLWKEERGISDKSSLKSKAATVVGGPHGQGPKELTESDITKRLDEFPKNVANWTPEDHKRWNSLESEIMKSKGGR